MPAYINKNRFYIHTNEVFAKYWEDYFNNNTFEADNRFGIYIDFPFCLSRCDFCVFGSNLYNKWKKYIPYYENSVLESMDSVKHVIPQTINWIYFGGGTPSLWSREALVNMTKTIPRFHEAKVKVFEAHPHDLTDEYLDFILNTIGIDVISIGVQSLDLESNKHQRRIPTTLDDLKRIVNFIHSNGKYVNIDLVALFDYGNPHGWDIYRNDLSIVVNEILPDNISSIPNYRSNNFYQDSFIFREITKDILDKQSRFTVYPESCLSQDPKDVMKFAESSYTISTPGIKNLYTDNECSLSTDPFILDRHTTMAFGGYMHDSISRLGKIRKDIHSSYDFMRHKFIHKVFNTKVEKDDGENESIIFHAGSLSNTINKN